MNRIVRSPELAEPVGFAHAVVAGPGRTVYLGGQTAQGLDGAIVGTTLLEQFDVAAGNVVKALTAAGATPADLVSLVVYTTAVPEYRASLRELGRTHQSHFGRHYPAMALFGVTALMDPEALIELVGIAVTEGDRDGIGPDRD
jgi:enamine deaminase RidA (YjgF/YER057c/UK114 family)